MAPSRLVLKVGAVVMFVKNKFDDSGRAQYVNGTLGKVVGFSEIDDYPIVETCDKRKITANPKQWAIEEGDEIFAEITQIPLRLAWAITVHKSQGMSLDEVVVDLGQAFDFGMGYVALSRVRTLEGMELLGLNKMALCVSPEIAEKDKEFLKQSKFDTNDLKKMSDKEIKKREKECLGLMLKKEKHDLFDGIFT